MMGIQGHLATRSDANTRLRAAAQFSGRRLRLLDAKEENSKCGKVRRTFYFL